MLSGAITKRPKWIVSCSRFVLLPGQVRYTNVVFTVTGKTRRLDIVARSARLRDEFPNHFHQLRCIPRAHVELVVLKESLDCINDHRTTETGPSSFPGPGCHRKMIRQATRK